MVGGEFTTEDTRGSVLIRGGKAQIAEDAKKIREGR